MQAWAYMPRSSATAIPYCVTVVGFNDWLAMGLQSLLKLNFHSCSLRVTSNFLSKTATVGASMTSAGNPVHRLATQFYHISLLGSCRFLSSLLSSFCITMLVDLTSSASLPMSYSWVPSCFCILYVRPYKCLE